MDGRHVIEVILQGYDRLTNVINDAANRSAPAFQRIEDRFKKSRKEAELANRETENLSGNIASVGDSSDVTRTKLDRLTQSFSKLRQEARNRIFPPEETPDQLFNRLSREGKSPQRPGGGFISRADFVEQERLRREDEANAAAIKRDIGLLSQLEDAKNKVFQGKSPLDDIFRGFRTGTQAINEGTIVPPEGGLIKQIRQREQERISAIKEEEAVNKATLLERLEDKRKEAIEETAIVTKTLNEDIEATRKSRDAFVDGETSKLDALKSAHEKRIADRKREIDSEISAEELATRKRKIDIDSELGKEIDALNIRKREEAKLRPEDGETAAQKRAAKARTEAIRDEVAAARRGAADAKALEDDNLAAFKASRAQRLQALESELQQEFQAAERASKRELAQNKRDNEEIIRNNKDQIHQIEQEAGRAADRAAAVEKTKFDERVKERIRVAKAQTQAEIVDLPNIIKDVNQQRADSFKELPFIERESARVGAALDDLGRGFKGGRKDLEEFRGEAGRAQTAFAQAGAEMGRFTKNVNSLVNVRWSLLLSLISVLGTVIVNLGAALVAVASSAILAGAALGGALIAGVAQALPVVGLLYSAFHEISNIMKVVQERQQARNAAANRDATAEKQRRDAANSLADAHYSLKQAIEGVGNAERSLRDAHERVTQAENEQKSAVADLARARRDAARGIVDANFAERDAVLSLQQAELGVLSAKKALADFEAQQRRNRANLADAQAALREAQDRLALAKQQGDAAEIAAAQSAVNVAKGNLSNIQDQASGTDNQLKQLQLALKQAQLQLEEARVAAARAREDAATARKQGIDNSPQVVAALDRIRNANRQVRDAVQGVTDAERQLRDSRHSVVQAYRAISDAEYNLKYAIDQRSSSQKQAARDFAKLSPAEKDFVLQIERFKAQWKKAMTPINDIIIGGVSNALNGVIKLLQDPDIQKALTGLAKSIASIGKSFSNWLISPEGKRDILTFIHEATKNLPVMAKAAGEFAKALANIAISAGPIFSDLLGGLANLGKGLDSYTSKAQKLDPATLFHHRETNDGISRLDKFFANAEKHLVGWEHLIGAVGRFLGALVNAAAGPGLKMVDGMAGAFNNLADKINKNPKPVREFFEAVRDNLKSLIPVLARFSLILIKAFSSKEFINFTKFILLTVIPAIVKVVEAFGKFLEIISYIGKIPVFGPLITQFAKFVIGLGLFWGILTKLLPVLKVFNPLIAALLKDILKGAALAARAIVTELIPAIASLGEALVAFVAANPIVLAVALAVAALVVLQLKFHAVTRIVQAVVNNIVELFTHPVKWLQTHWKQLIVAAVLAPFGAFPALIYSLLGVFFPKFQKKITDGFLAPFEWLGNWFKKIGTWLYDHLIKPIISYFEIASPSKLMERLGKQVVDGFVNAFTSLPGRLLGILRSLPKRIVGLFDGIGTKIAKNLYEGFKAAISKIHIHIKTWHGIPTGFSVSFGGGKDSVDESGSNKPISTVVGGYNKAGQFTPSITQPPQKKATGGVIDGPQGTDTVPAWLTPGEWVLNHLQRSKLAALLGMDEQYIEKLLFDGNNATGRFSLGGVIGGIGHAVASPFEKAWASDQHQGRFEAAWNVIAPHLPRWYNNHDMTGRIAQKIADHSNWHPDKFIQYAGNGATRLRVLVRDKNGQLINAYNIGKHATARRYAEGGVVSFSAPGARRFQSGGIVPGVVQNTPRGGTIVNQEFSVQTQGESDWNHIMHLGALKAQEAF